MARNSKNQKQNKMDEAVAKRQRTAQVLMAVFAIILIISMVLSAVAKY